MAVSILISFVSVNVLVAAQVVWVAWIVVVVWTETAGMVEVSMCAIHTASSRHIWHMSLLLLPWRLSKKLRVSVGGSSSRGVLHKQFHRA